MHDPMSVAHEIWLFGRPLVTVWHRDPETDGTDDSCGWFLRARHLDQPDHRRDHPLAWKWAG